MYKFILVLAITSSSAFASSNILPETKSARNPASDSPPQLDQVRVLLFEKTFRRTMQWGNTTSPAPMLETCGNPEKDRRRLTQEYNKFDIIIPPFDQIPPDCFATVSTAASTKAYIDYIENQLAQKMDRYVKAVDQIISKRIEQKIKDKTVQDHLQMEAVRILEANAAIRNQ